MSQTSKYYRSYIKGVLNAPVGTRREGDVSCELAFNSSEKIARPEDK